MNKAHERGGGGGGGVKIELFSLVLLLVHDPHERGGGGVQIGLFRHSRLRSVLYLNRASISSEPGEHFLLAIGLLGEQNLRSGEQIVTR